MFVVLTAVQFRSPPPNRAGIIIGGGVLGRVVSANVETANTGEIPVTSTTLV